MDHHPNVTSFSKAVPVWPDYHESRNKLVRFSLRLSKIKGAFLRFCAADLIRVCRNGDLIYYGPARAAAGYARVCEVSLPDGEGLLTADVLSYGINQYACVRQEAFFMAEIVCGDRVFCPTSPSGGEWKTTFVTERLSNVQRYSFQRGFSEYWVCGPTRKAEPVKELKTVPMPHLLKDRTPHATLSRLAAEGPVISGNVKSCEKPHFVYADRSLVSVGEMIGGYPKDELAVCLTDDVGKMLFSDAHKGFSRRMQDKTFATYSFGRNRTGLLFAKVRCERDAKLYVLMDELMVDGDLDPFRMGDVCQIAGFDLGPGDHDLLTMETFTASGLKFVLTEGAVEILDCGFYEVASSAPLRKAPDPVRKDPELARIWNAAVESFRQNALDIFMDCPSRERAGWLCDSFFTARTEKCLTGNSVTEHAFLENYLLYPDTDEIPSGMFPMCYPSSHIDHVYIPNWAMWLVLELEEHALREEGTDLVEKFRERIRDLIHFLDRYLNDDGLLEHLDSWVFVEWSRANEWVQDVNYPSNMLYARVLEAYGTLYDDPAYVGRANRMRETIIKQSFNGCYFRDHAIRHPDGTLEVANDISEVAQYMALFMNICSRDDIPDFFDRVIGGFGPGRENAHKDVAPANAFVGHYLRLELLSRYGMNRQLSEEIRYYFGDMSQKTGTLWENDTPHASLCHGFASCVTCWLVSAFEDPATIR